MKVLRNMNEEYENYIQSESSLFIFMLIDEGMFLYQDRKLDSDVVRYLLTNKYIICDGVNYHQSQKSLRYKLIGKPYDSKFYRRIPINLRELILDKYNNQCNECDSEKDLEIDHIFPWSLGGLTERSNLQVLCKPCNTKKTNKI